jgi:hypothetical protein
LKIYYVALINLLCDGKELNYAPFNWYAHVEARDEFGANIIKITAGVRLYAIVPHLSIFIKFY